MPAAAADSGATDFFVDGHVHVYPGMSVDKLLAAAAANLGKAGSAGAARAEDVLFVADPEGIQGFERLLAYGEGSGASACSGQWTLAEADSQSVSFRRHAGRGLTAVRGQQLITREGLELLGMACRSALPSGLPLSSLIERVRAAGGWSIVAWGAGKWLGRRGRVVTDMIAAEGGRPDVMLGDNGGRPRCWSRVPQFAAAAERGMRILAGTDPLPLQGEEDRVGSYGFRVRAVHNGSRPPVEALRQALEQAGTPVTTFGEQMSIGRFASNQLRLRLRRGPGAGPP